MSKPPSPDPRDSLVQREDLDEGLRFLHRLVTHNSRELIELTARVMALTEELVAGGEVDLRNLDERRERSMSREHKRTLHLPVIVADDTPDKYAITDLPDIDCESRIPLCKAQCCTFAFPLSFQDLDEGVVRWEYGQPYRIRHDEAGYCVHNEPSKGCGVYEHRPAICRRYDCRHDRRVWKDFENRIPAPHREAPPPDGAEE